MARQYVEAARRVIAGKTTVDSAVGEISRGTKMSTSSVREQLNTMISVVRGDSEEVPAKMTAKISARIKTRAAPATRRKLEHVDASEFALLRDELGLSNKETAIATGRAGMGASSTYVSILMKDGASVNLYDRFETALRAYVNARDYAASFDEVDDVYDVAVFDEVAAERFDEAAAERDSSHDGFEPSE